MREVLDSEDVGRRWGGWKRTRSIIKWVAARVNQKAAEDGTIRLVPGDNWPKDLRRAANISRVIALFWKGEDRKRNRECWRAERCDAGLAELDPPLFT